MKANISKELEYLINEKIFLDLEVHILSKRLNDATQKKEQKLIKFYEVTLNKKFLELKKVNDQLRQEKVKIHEPINDGLFVQYNFYLKVNGGYKEGYMSYWKDAMKYKLNQRLNHTKTYPN